MQQDMTPSLVIKLREGQQEAAALLDKIYRLRLIRFCSSYLGNREEAEDVVQDVFYTILVNDTIPSNFRGWIYEICRNRCIDRLRAAKRRLDDQSLPSASYLAAQETGKLTRLVKGEQRARILQRLASLPSEQREVLLLRYIEGLSRPEIATVLAIPEKLVKHRIYNGISKLRDTSITNDS